MKINYSESSYVSTPLSNVCTSFEVTPIAPLGRARLIASFVPLAFVFLIIGGGIGPLAPPWGALVVMAFVWAAYKFFVNHWRSHNRKFAQFSADASAITLSSGEKISVAQIGRLYLSSPKVAEVLAHHTSFNYNGGGFTQGTSRSAGVDPRLAARCWQVIIEAGGKSHSLAGGLQEVTARALMFELGQVIGWKFTP